MPAPTHTDRGLTHGSYPFDNWEWEKVSNLKPLEAVRRVGYTPTPEEKKQAKSGDFYVVHNKCYVVLDSKGMADFNAKAPFPKGTKALFCANGRHMIIEKR